MTVNAAEAVLLSTEAVKVIEFVLKFANVALLIVTFPEIPFASVDCVT